MKIICPKCSARLKIGDDSRYNSYNCPKCNYLFYGIEGEVDLLDWAFGAFFTFNREYNYANRTGCPHCRSPIWLRAYPRGGFDGPSRCPTCNKRLLDRDEVQEGRDEPYPPARTSGDVSHEDFFIDSTGRPCFPPS